MGGKKVYADFFFLALPRPNFRTHLFELSNKAFFRKKPTHFYIFFSIFSKLFWALCCNFFPFKNSSILCLSFLFFKIHQDLIKKGSLDTSSMLHRDIRWLTRNSGVRRRSQRSHPLDRTIWIVPWTVQIIFWTLLLLLYVQLPVWHVFKYFAFCYEFTVFTINTSTLSCVTAS